MDQLFWIQAIVAFFIGGIAISLLTIVAEKTPQNLSGIILSLPTNMVIGLFFLALVNSPESVASNIEGVPLTLGGAILYVVAYLLTARFIFKSENTSKWLVIPTCLVAALGAWFIFPLLIVYYGTPNLIIGLIIFGVVVALTQYFLSYLSAKSQAKVSKPKKLLHGPTVLFRAVLAGSVIVTALVVSKTLGPFWGVVVGSSFPAAYTATLIALHLQSNAASLLSITKMLPLGTTGQMFYVLAIAITYPTQGLWLGTATAYLMTIGYYLCLTKVQQKLS